MTTVIPRGRWLVAGLVKLAVVALLISVASLARGQTVVLDFEGLGNLEQILNF